MSSMDFTPLIIIITGLSCAYVGLSSVSYQDAEIEQTHYCEMVSKWNEFSHLPPEERPGWPPYKGGCNGDK